MTVASVDEAVVRWMTTHRWPPLNDPMVWLGNLNRLGAVWVALALVIAAQHRSDVLRGVQLGLLTALTTLLADSASFGVKHFVERPRPFVADPTIEPLYAVHSSSFPAGHAATAFAGATIVSHFAPRARPLFFALAAAIALSRVYVGVHYPGDVIGGAALGVLVGFIAIPVVRVHGRVVSTTQSPLLRPRRLLRD